MQQLLVRRKVFLKKSEGWLSVGGNSPIRVNCNVGINSDADRDYEILRLKAIKDSKCLPDTFMDLSIGQYGKPFYKEIQTLFDCPIGYVPSYMFSQKNKVKKETAVDIIKQLADDGISFFTLHLTASLELYKKAKDLRKIPVTSRGGAFVLQQLKANEGMNIWKICLPEIIEIVKNYGIVISLGTTFRPAGIADACDEIHLLETEEQLLLCKMLQSEGLQVMVENVGHISIDKMENHCRLLRQFNAPIMPLGPIPTDTAIGQDHISAAIGAAFLCYHGCADIINCVTRYEHTGDEITADAIIESVKAMRVVAQTINVCRGFEDAIENEKRINRLRANNRSCVIGNGQCDRCQNVCPLKMI